MGADTFLVNHKNKTYFTLRKIVGLKITDFNDIEKDLLVNSPFMVNDQPRLKWLAKSLKKLCSGAELTDIELVGDYCDNPNYPNDSYTEIGSIYNWAKLK